MKDSFINKVRDRLSPYMPSMQTTRNAAIILGASMGLLTATTLIGGRIKANNLQSKLKPYKQGGFSNPQNIQIYDHNQVLRDRIALARAGALWA